jgi:leucyl-tRNA synthetase
LMNYGTGAVMAVPGHDERDNEFATVMGLPILNVIDGEDPFAKEGTMVNSQFLDGLTVQDAIKKMTAWLEDAEKGRGLVNYRLRDWLVSRQRYWGAPIPIVYDPEGKPHPIPEEHLPWILPTDVEFKPDGKSPLSYSKEFIERTEKIFGKGWTPEFDTMDTFVCSSFYYLRYLAEGDEKKLVDPHVERNWMPVDMYIGGPEHACMHLIYARFVMMALKDMGHVSHDEPFKRLVHQGLVTNQGAKMSKSKGNTVSPDEFVDYYGSDVFRMYLMFMGPFTDGGDWNDSGIKGVARFVQRLWRFMSAKTKDGHTDAKEVTAALHKAIKAVTEGLEKMKFNTAISNLMELLNELEKHEAVSADTAKTIAKLLSPIAPHLAEELWEMLNNVTSSGDGTLVIDQHWPAFDPVMLKSDMLTVVVQINGKVRGDVTVPADMSKEDILTAAKANENVQKYLEGATIKKEIYVPGKLISLVI